MTTVSGDEIPLETAAARIDADPQLLRFWLSRLSGMFSETTAAGLLTPRDVARARGVRVLLREHGRTLLDLERLLAEEGPGAFDAAGAEAAAPADPFDPSELAIDDGSVADPAGPQDKEARLRDALDGLLALRARLEQAKEPP